MKNQNSANMVSLIICPRVNIRLKKSRKFNFTVSLISRSFDLVPLSSPLSPFLSISLKKSSLKSTSHIRLPSSSPAWPPDGPDRATGRGLPSASPKLAGEVPTEEEEAGEVGSITGEEEELECTWRQDSNSMLKEKRTPIGAWKYNFQSFKEIMTD